MKEILYYTKNNGRCPYDEWFSKLDIQTQIRISGRIERLIDGQYGETRKLVSQNYLNLNLSLVKDTEFIIKIWMMS